MNTKIPTLIALVPMIIPRYCPDESVALMSVVTLFFTRTVGNSVAIGANDGDDMSTLVAETFEIEALYMLALYMARVFAALVCRSLINSFDDMDSSNRDFSVL